MAAEHPSSQQFIVAHSHGGNVARLAFRDPDVAALVRGLACLSTPFIHAQSREFDEAQSLGLWWLVTSTLVAIPFVLLNEVFQFQQNDLFWPSVLTLFGSVAIGVLAGFKLLLALSELASRHHARLIVDDSRVPLLIIRTAGDEASGALLVANVAAFLVNKVYDILCWVAGLPVVVVFAIAGLLLWLGRTGVVFLLIFVISLSFLIFSVAVVWTVGLFGIPVALFGIVVTLFGIVLRAASGLGFGSSSLLLDITTETTPPGDWVVHNVPTPRKGFSLDNDGEMALFFPRLFGSHSAAYENEAALDLIAVWVTALRNTGMRG